MLRLELLDCGSDMDLSTLYRRCAHADPNYGMLWLHCKKVLASAVDVLDVRADPRCPGPQIVSTIRALPIHGL
jgi:hypothetical protein